MFHVKHFFIAVKLFHVKQFGKTQTNRPREIGASFKIQKNNAKMFHVKQWRTRDKNVSRETFIKNMFKKLTCTYVKMV